MHGLSSLTVCIQSALASPQHDPAMLRRLAAEHGTACQEVNGRLARCVLLIKQGKVCEAQDIARREPNLLEVVAAFDFPGRLRWQQLLQQYQIPVPPPLRVDLLPLLRAAGITESVPAPKAPPPLTTDPPPVVAPPPLAQESVRDLQLPSSSLATTAVVAGVAVLLLVFFIGLLRGPTPELVAKHISPTTPSTAEEVPELPELQPSPLPRDEPAPTKRPNPVPTPDEPVLSPEAEAAPMPFVDSVEEPTVGAGPKETRPTPTVSWVRPDDFAHYPVPAEDVPLRTETSALAMSEAPGAWSRPVTIWLSSFVPKPDTVRLLGADGIFVIIADPDAKQSWTIARTTSKESPFARLAKEDRQGGTFFRFQWLPESGGDSSQLALLRRCALEMVWGDTELHLLFAKPERADPIELSSTFERTELLKEDGDLAIHLVGANRFEMGRVVNASEHSTLLLDEEPRIGIRASVHSVSDMRIQLLFEIGLFASDEEFKYALRTIFGSKARVKKTVEALATCHKKSIELEYRIQEIQQRMDSTYSSKKAEELVKELHSAMQALHEVEKEQSAILRIVDDSLSDKELRSALLKCVTQWTRSGMPQVQATVYRRVHDAAKSRWLGIPIRIYGGHSPTVEVLSL